MEDDKLQEIRERAEKIEHENYYEMLGVPRDAPAKGIETAYYGMVKKWHPDRIPAEVVAPAERLPKFVDERVSVLVRERDLDLVT